MHAKLSLSSLSQSLSQPHPNAANPNFSLSSTTQAPCTHSHSNLLTLISNAHSFHQTKLSHASALLNALLPHSVSLCTSLMLSFSTFGDPTASRFLFQQTFHHCRNAFLWNILIRDNYIAKIFDGFETYNRMVRTGVRPNDHTFPFILKASSDYMEVRKGMEVHGVVFKLGFDLDVFFGNTLLMIYGNCGGLSYARKVFDEMPERAAVEYDNWGVFG